MLIIIVTFFKKAAWKTANLFINNKIEARKKNLLGNRLNNRRYYLVMRLHLPFFIAFQRHLGDFPTAI